MEPEVEADIESADPTALSQAPTALEVLRDRNVIALLSMLFCFSTAVFAQATTIGWQVLHISDREIDLGFVGLAEFLPAALLVIVTGWVADRYDRRLVTGIAITAELGVTAGLALYAASDPTAVGPIFVLAFAFGAARSFAAPAERALKPLVVLPESLPRLVAMHSSVWQISLVVGPVLAGLVISVSIAAAYLMSGVLLIAALVLLCFVRYRVRPSPTHEAPTIHAALGGLRVIGRSPILLGAISLDLMAVLFGGAVALLPAIAQDQLHVGSAGFGLLRAAGGVGAGVVALSLSVRPLRHRVGSRLFVAVGAFGVFTIVLGVTRQMWVAMVAVALLMAADMISVFIRATLVPL
ncbi:MAG TPA: MFS transporter, partial [Microthrixaceae bacterium]|nr:MFS transporter [Microthrixaceae bacterium]